MGDNCSVRSAALSCEIVSNLEIFVASDLSVRVAFGHDRHGTSLLRTSRLDLGVKIWFA
jgi:hypothetical protein